MKVLYWEKIMTKKNKINKIEETNVDLQKTIYKTFL